MIKFVDLYFVVFNYVRFPRPKNNDVQTRIYSVIATEINVPRLLEK